MKNQLVILSFLQVLILLNAMENFGMNKPHLLFHLGSRAPLSYNIGFGYWFEKAEPNKEDPFTPVRMQYKTTKDGLYVDMKAHDGDNFFEEVLQDQLGVNTTIKYQNIKQKDKWQSQFTFYADKVNHSKLYGFHYFSIENSDRDKIEHDPNKGPPMAFQLESEGDLSAKVTLLNAHSVIQRFKLEATSKVRLLGIYLNISESFQVGSIISRVQQLVKLEKYPLTPRNTDPKVVAWEDKQLNLMKSGNWKGIKVTMVVLFYQLDLSLSPHKITLSNSSSPFDQTYFQSRKNDILEQYSTHQEQYREFLMHIYFNLYGGKCYYYGGLFTQHSLLSHGQDFSYTFTPSRYIFPRSFLWDDGFHLSVIVHHNQNMALDIIHNWARKIDLFGWIGREQIRGLQMIYLMPDIRFVYQDIFEMNPPTLILPIITMIEKDQEHTNQRLYSFLSNNIWKLEKWYRYFKKTQSHKSLFYKEEINQTIQFRWKCKDECQKGNFMGSGLDDYPRVNYIGEIAKEHIDLISWLHIFAEGLAIIYQYLGSLKQARYYKREMVFYSNKLFKECYDSEDRIFKDSVVTSKDNYQVKWVEHIGYVTLFPFLAGILKGQHITLEKYLQLMNNESILMSEDGLRSLSLSDPAYGTDENYWRGPVWLPINYLVLRACKRYYWQEPGVKEFYQRLRERLIETGHRNFQQSGYLFENYHEGKGNRGYPFNGWTSLLANIIVEQY